MSSNGRNTGTRTCEGSVLPGSNSVKRIQYGSNSKPLRSRVVAHKSRSACDARRPPVPNELHKRSRSDSADGLLFRTEAANC
eukprot:2660666-Alexandrium_andersonii.AAC.1